MLRYTPSDCFETFPFPDDVDGLLKHWARRYYEHRSQIMLARTGGPDQDLQPLPRPRRIRRRHPELRDLHVEMDKAVAAAYGWDDLDLGHGFHETKQGTRFTISESARREVLARLLKLNHERYAEEVEQGLHDKKGERRARRTAAKKPAAGPQVEGSSGGAQPLRRRRRRPRPGRRR